MHITDLLPRIGDSVCNLNKEDKWMNNYKDTGRVYTLQDLFDLGLKLEVGDTIIHDDYMNFSEGRELDLLGSYNEPSRIGTDQCIELVSSKQLDEYLSKGAIKSVEWDGEGLPPVGVECEAYDYGDGLWRKVKTLDAITGSKEMAVASIGDRGLFAKVFWAVKFRKAETPEQKAERERLEAAYDLYCHLCKAKNNQPKNFDNFKSINHSSDAAAWVELAKITNYRKQ